MSMATVKQQRGITFVNLMAGAFLLVVLAIGGMKIIPAFAENKAIQGILDTVAHDPEMQGAEIRTIKDSFYKRATTMNNITVIGPDDLIVDKTPQGLVLSASYKVKIPLMGNASLLLEFEPSSARPR